MAIQEEYGCEGFYGFGAGVEIARNALFAGAGLYCSRGPTTGCPISQKCWDAHRERVNVLLPAVAEFIEKLQARGFQGPQLAKMVYDELGTEPYSAVMLGNIEDGGAIANGLPPKDRSEMTLPYPFKEKN